MTGTVQTKKGRPNYYIVLDYINDAGERKRPWVSTDIPVKGNNKRLANARLKEVLDEYDKKKVDLSKSVLFVDFYRLWLDSIKYSVAPTTYIGYELIFKAYIMPYFEPTKIKVRDLTPMNLQQYVSTKTETLSPNTIIKHLRNISKCLDDAVVQNIIAFNPAKRIAMPKKIKYTGAKHYNEHQITLLLERSANDPLNLVVFLTVFYGLRRSEILGLKWDSVDEINDTITIKHTVTEINNIINKTNATKNDSSYAELPLPAIVKQRLETWKAEQLRNKLLQSNDYVDEGYICTDLNGHLLKPNYVTSHFKLLLEKCNLPRIRFHDLRHSAACYLKYLGFDLKDIQVWLRHGDIQTTMNIYVNLGMDEKIRIANSLNKKFKKMMRA